MPVTAKFRLCKGSFPEPEGAAGSAALGKRRGGKAREGRSALGLFPLALLLGILASPACRFCSSLHTPAQKPSPLSAEEQQATFSLPEGFSIELVAADPDVPKIVDIAFDDAGRMWAVTAQEYPMDQNDGIADAPERYRRRGRDLVLVFDTPTRPGRQKARVFAEGMFLPLSVLPLQNEVLVCQGPDILRLRDADGDGRTDERHVLLTGFGVQDSPTNTHRLLRGPEGWIYVAQGGFAESRVQRPGGPVVPFDACKVGRFRKDGSGFEVFTHGLLNVWGIVFDEEGDFWIQEANDIGYSVVPAFPGTSYPGLGRHRSRPYTPWHPPLADFRVGGTGLSGLALSQDLPGFPEPFQDVFLLANPITRRIHSVRAQREGEALRLEQGPDLLTSSDPWFRPVALYFGPDGALYGVDWYNKIIRHNEVARTHPDRDKVRTRIWRVRHSSMPRRAIPDLTRVPAEELTRHLEAGNTWEARAAWHQMADRQATGLAPRLQQWAQDPNRTVRVRLLALWSLEEMEEVEEEFLVRLLRDPHRAVRREAVRILAKAASPDLDLTALLEPLTRDPDPQVRWQTIEVFGSTSTDDLAATRTLLQRVRPPLLEFAPERPMREVVFTQPAYSRAFERSLLRALLEDRPEAVRPCLESADTLGLSLESRLLGWLTLGGREEALPEERRLLAPRALSVLENAGPSTFQSVLRNRRAGPELRRTAVLALAESGDLERVRGLFAVWDSLEERERRTALTGLSGTPAGATALLHALEANRLSGGPLDSWLLERMRLVLGADHPGRLRLQRRVDESASKVLYLPGGRPVSFADTNLRLLGPFTVECWIRLEDPIGGGDGILGDHVSATFNFQHNRLRVTLGSAGQDLVVSSTAVRPDEWFHVAVTRDDSGILRIYLNGELDAVSTRAWTEPFEDLDVGRTQPLIYPPLPGTQGSLAEFRVWNRARSGREIWETHLQSFQDLPRPPRIGPLLQRGSVGTAGGAGQCGGHSGLSPLDQRGRGREVAGAAGGVAPLGPGGRGRGAGKENFRGTLRGVPPHRRGRNGPGPGAGRSRGLRDGFVASCHPAPQRRGRVRLPDLPRPDPGKPDPGGAAGE